VTDTPEQPKAPAWKPGCFTYGFAALVLIFAISFFGGLGGGSGSNDSALVVACQNVVKNNLKAPSTANFVGVPKLSGGLISGQVEADNSFGASLRSSFQCTVIDSETVRLDFIR